MRFYSPTHNFRYHKGEDKTEEPREIVVSKIKIKKLYSNLVNSLNGLKIVSKENSFILELALGVFLIPYIFLSNIDLNYKIILSVLYFLLLAFEIMNTAVEKLCDRVTTDLDPEIKKIKDLSSAAVFVVLLILIITFLASFWVEIVAFKI